MRITRKRFRTFGGLIIMVLFSFMVLQELSTYLTQSQHDVTGKTGSYRTRDISLISLIYGNIKQAILTYA